MIVVMEWADGFGNDGYVSGLYSSLEKARENTNYDPEAKNGFPPVFFDIKPDIPQVLDYHEGKALFSKSKGKNRKK